MAKVKHYFKLNFPSVSDYKARLFLNIPLSCIIAFREYLNNTGQVQTYSNLKISY